MATKMAILCVDDDKLVLDSLKSQLRRTFGAKYVYETAEAAEDAYEIIEELAEEGVTVLLIVSDWLMPRIKGDEFLIEVHRRFPGVIKVMLTGQATPEAIERARRGAGLYRCLHKPWSEAELVETIQQALGAT
jgi:CheY-like chemotaxis protein